MTGIQTCALPIYTIVMSETDMCVLFGGPCEVKAGIPPIAEFAVNDSIGCHPFEVEFTDLSTSFTTDWFWDFGDGGTDTQEDPTYTYGQDTGFFSVSHAAT